MRRLAVAAAVLVSAPLSPGLASAQDTIGLQTPSHNIFCMLSLAEAGSPEELRCDLQEQSTRLAGRPSDCDLEWGDAFAVGPASRRGYLLCHGDTTRDDSLPVLPYGAAWRRDGFTCDSSPSGLTCANAYGHGFKISRGQQKLF